MRLAEDHRRRAFVAGNEAYEAGEFIRAVEQYDSAAVRAPNAALYYNRGNARFKLGQVGRAIADYNRAFVLAPGDPDIVHNLEFARAWRRDRPAAAVNPVLAALVRVLRLLSPALAGLLSGLLFLLCAACFGLLAYTRARAWLWPALILFLLFGYAVGSRLSWSGELSPDRAVVIRPEVALRSGPGEDYGDLIVVHDGLEVVVRERRGAWVLLQAPGGEGGWADSSAVETIFPRR
ncbi:MAG TPA: tetratricopeptide repeat protein [candidate division WOR-3 bacterium]|uniref:Tetratricopeptide repeat protein n=1 Tax=candidate division WOR-3 bacterium TaxID=2052148 RepID=A0A7V0T4A7_UNCW3|nr:tetratricopeptide repeat protein [candidate division WOR-3 bacterium]